MYSLTTVLNPPYPPLQRGNFLPVPTVFNPSLEKHALSEVEGRGKGEIFAEMTSKIHYTSEKS